MKINYTLIKNKLLNEKENKRIVGLCTYITLGIVALVMTVMNIVTKKGILTVATGVFTVLCAVNILLILYSRIGVKIAASLFAVELLALFSFFLISGNPDGFSAIWIVLLPYFGMLFFGRKKGIAISVLIFLEMILFFWTPVGEAVLRYDYSRTFMMRFPVLYIACFLLAIFLETLRLTTYDEMKRMQELYHDLSIRDPLTGALNRQGMYSLMEDISKDKHQSIGVAMFDIDFFKKINDTYGHTAGDIILHDFVAMMGERLDASICRWGGEEFIAIFFDGAVTEQNLEDFRKEIESHAFNGADEIRMTVSIGVYELSGGTTNDIDEYIKNADIAMYKSKRYGRNKIEYYHV